MSRYCKQLGLPIFVVGKNNRFPPGCTVLGNFTGATGRIKVRLPSKFGVMEPMTGPTSLQAVQAKVEEKLDGSEYLLVVWSENRDQAWAAMNAKVNLPGRIEVHVLVYDGCYQGPSISDEKRILNTPFFKRLRMQRIQGIGYSNNMYVRKTADRKEVKAIRIKLFSTNWDQATYEENELYYSNDASEENNQVLWQIKQLRNQQAWGIFPLNGEGGRTTISTTDSKGNLVFRDGTTIYVKRSSNNRKWWWEKVDKPTLTEYATPAPYGMDLTNQKLPMPRSKASETWYKKVEWSKQRAEEYMKTVVSLSYPTIQRRIREGADPIMCLGAAGTFLLEEHNVFRYTEETIVEEAKRFKKKHQIPDMPTDSTETILQWFEKSKQYTAARKVEDADCKRWPRPTENAWGGIVDGKVAYARYLVPSTEEVFTEIIQYYDRNGFIRSGVRGGKNTPPLRALTQWEQAMILSTNCKQTTRSAFTDAMPQAPVDMEALKAERCDPPTVIRRRPAKPAVALAATPFDPFKKDVQNALKSNDFNQGEASPGKGTGVSINPAGAFHIVQTLNPGAKDVVADFGSGTGRVLVAFAKAAELANIPLSVIGVEYAKELFDISKKLTAPYKSISVYDDDLAKIDPVGERYKSITHVFLANPGMPQELLVKVFQTVRQLPNLKQIAFFKYNKQNIFNDLANSNCCSKKYFGRSIRYGKSGTSQLYVSTKAELETFANQQDLKGQQIAQCQTRIRKNQQLVREKHIRDNTGSRVNVHNALVQYANRMCEDDTTSVDSKMEQMDAIFAARFDPTPLQSANLPDTVNVQLPDGLRIMKSINRSWTGSLPSNCILPYYDRVLREMAIYYRTEGETVIYGNRNECLPLTEMDTERVESFRKAAVDLTGGNNNILQTFYNNYKEGNVTQETLEDMIKVFVEQAGIQEVGDMEDSTEIILDQALYKLFNHKTLDNALGFGYSTTYSHDHYTDLSYKAYSYDSDGCRRPSASNEDQTNDYVLRLDTSEKSTTIQDLVNTFQAEELLEDATPPTRRRFMVSHHSDYLMLQYKRTQVTIDADGTAEERVDTTPVEPNDTIVVNQTTFYFIGALVWKETPGGDHYITYLKSGPNNKWQRYDDSRPITPLVRKPRELSKAYVYLYTTKTSPTFLTPVPLPNVGNSCWMNGALQLLLAIPELWVPGKSCPDTKNAVADSNSEITDNPVPRLNFPTLIDVRGPYVFSDAAEVCVFAPAETETSDPQYVRIEGLNKEWMNEPFAKRFLSAITGLGWMQPDFAFDPLKATWTHPSNPLPHCLHTFDYTEDELQKMQQVTINGQLFPEWLHGMYNNKDAHKQSFCTVMQRLVGLDTTNNVRIEAACIEASGGKYKVLLYLPVLLSVQFGKGLPMAYPIGSHLVDLDTKAMVGAREREPIVPRQRLNYPNSCSFQVVTDSNATHQFESSLLRPLVLQNHTVEKRNVDTFVVSIKGTLSNDMTYFLVEKMYETFGTWNGKIKKVPGAKRVAPAIVHTAQVCFEKWETFFQTNTNYNEWDKNVLLRLCKNKDTRSFFEAFMRPVRLITSAELGTYSLANGINLGNFYNELSSLRVQNKNLQTLLNRLKLLIRMNQTTAISRTIHLGKPYYNNNTKLLLSGKELFKLATSKKKRAPNLENQDWVQHTMPARTKKAMPLSLYATETDQVKGFTRCAFFQVAILYDLFQKYKRLQTKEAPAYTMIEGWYNAFSAHIDDTRDNVCLQIRSQTRYFSKKHAACQPFRGGAIENLDVLTGPSHPALVWMKHVRKSYGNELQQQLEQLMGDFYREPVGKKKIESIVTKKTYRKTLLVDFFCGCGGFTAGMAKSGFFEPLLAVDIQEFKLLMMQSNFPNVVCMRWMLKTGEIDMTNAENNEPADKEEMLNTIVELGIQRANLGEAARQQWKNGVWPTDYPPLHIHGSPSCQDLSSANQQGKRNKTSETTMGWYTGFIHYLRRRNVPHTMSLEEADIQFDRDSADPNKQALLQVAKFAITDVLGAEERDPSTPFDPTKTYYAHINYERCGVPSTGRRLFCAKGWDPVSIGMRIQNRNALAGGNKDDDDSDMSTLFEKGNDGIFMREGKPVLTPATKTTMLKTFRIAAKAGVGGAKEWVQDFNNHVFTHQEGWANGFHGWFQTREGRKFSWQGTTKYAGKLDANGNPLQWRPKVGNRDDLADLSLSFLQDEGYNQYQPQVKHPPTTIRIRDPSTKPGYRPVVMMPFFWVKMYKEPIAIAATRTNTMGNVYPRWEGQYVPNVPVNMEFIRRISPEEGRVLMSFPGDWVFYCGDECMQKSGDQCAYTMPKGVWCMNQGAAAACCAKPIKKADPRVYSGKPDEDQKCYGDAVPPLISLRIAYEIVHKQGYSLLEGGADALIPYTNDLYAMVLQAEDQTEVMLDALYRFTQRQREHIGNPHFQHFLDPMDDFLTNRYRTNRGNPLGDASRKDYMAALTKISLDDGLLTPQGLRRLEAANRRRRQSSGAMGGTIVNAAYSKIIPFLTSSSTYNAREVAKILFGFPDENLVEDLKQVAEPWKEAAQVLLQKMRDCKQFGFSEAQTPEERRKVYLSQVRRYHPDKQGNKELFQQLVECYQE